jgi:integrase
MVRAISKLSPAKVRHVSEPGLHGDGAGLWLHVGPGGGKSWIFRYMLAGKARAMGLGALHTVGLAEARERAAAARRLCLDGIDPLEARNAARAGRAAKAATAVTFAKAAESYIAAHRAGWRNAKHARQWTSTLTTYVFPAIGNLPIADIDTGHLTRVLSPIWASKTDTANRIRNRIELILDYARTHGWRSGENPARWRGHLESILPHRSKVAPVRPFKAMPWQQIAPFMAELRAQEGIAARALEFTILTASRTGTVIGAVWSEIDIGAAIWTIPGPRMKAGREFRAPLSAAALELLRGLPGGAGSVFSGAGGQPLSADAMRALLRQIAGVGGPVVHGFRASLATWAAEAGWPADVVEAALAHVVGNETVRAYQRSDVLERRRALMSAWAAVCAGAETTADVVQLRQAVP